MPSKYDPLGRYLAERLLAEAPMSFDDIEAVIGCSLPPKAVNHPAWWSNNPTNNPMTRVWLMAGFRSERVDVASRRLVFRRVAGRAAPKTPPAGPPGRSAPPRGGGLLARIGAKMAGTVRLRAGVDLTGESGETWDAQAS